jgi:hypothetical protein
MCDAGNALQKAREVEERGEEMCPLLNEPIGGADSRPDGQIRGAESPWICGTKVAGRNQGPWRRSAPARSPRPRSPRARSSRFRRRESARDDAGDAGVDLGRARGREGTGNRKETATALRSGSHCTPEQQLLRSKHWLMLNERQQLHQKATAAAPQSDSCCKRKRQPLNSSHCLEGGSCKPE